MKTVQPVPEENQEQGFKAKFSAFVSFVVCSTLLIAIGIFLYVLITTEKSIHPGPTMEIKVDTYYVKGVSYLVFTKNSSMQIINYTSDSIDIINKMPRFSFIHSRQLPLFERYPEYDFFSTKKIFEK